MVVTQLVALQPSEAMILTDRDKLIKKTPQTAVLVGVLVMVWWIGVWGLVETLLQEFIQGSFGRAVGTYVTIIAGCLLVVYSNPQVLHYFI